MSDAEKLVAGVKAPNFEILDQDGKKVSLASFQGQKVIIYFYPAAATPGCTKEACDFNDNLNPLKAAGYTVLGISPDSVAKLKKSDMYDWEMMFAQANSEHCRHKIFNATWEIDGSARDRSLFQMIRNTHQLHSAGILSAYKDNAAVITGTNGSLSVPTMRLKTYPRPQDRSWWKEFEVGVVGMVRDDPLKHQMEHFGCVVRGEAEPLVSAQDGLLNLRITEAIVEAARSGQTVNLAGA